MYRVSTALACLFGVSFPGGFLRYKYIGKTCLVIKWRTGQRGEWVGLRDRSEIKLSKRDA